MFTCVWCVCVIFICSCVRVCHIHMFDMTRVELSRHTSLKSQDLCLSRHYCVVRDTRLSRHKCVLRDTRLAAMSHDTHDTFVSLKTLLCGERPVCHDTIVSKETLKRHTSCSHESRHPRHICVLKGTSLTRCHTYECVMSHMRMRHVASQLCRDKLVTTQLTLYPSVMFVS